MKDAVMHAWQMYKLDRSPTEDLFYNPYAYQKQFYYGVTDT